MIFDQKLIEAHSVRVRGISIFYLHHDTLEWFCERGRGELQQVYLLLDTCIKQINKRIFCGPKE